MNARGRKWLVAAGVAVSVVAWRTRVEPAGSAEAVEEPAAAPANPVAAEPAPAGTVAAAPGTTGLVLAV